MNAPNPFASSLVASNLLDLNPVASQPLGVPNPAPVRARRARQTVTAGPARADDTERSDDGWSLLYHGWTLMAPGGARVDLTATERACFLCLLRNPGRELVREELMAARNPASGRVSMRTLNVAICRLRHKVLQTGTRLPLHTVHGVGYVFLGNLREVSSR